MNTDIIVMQHLFISSRGRRLAKWQLWRVEVARRYYVWKVGGQSSPRAFEQVLAIIFRALLQQVSESLLAWPIAC